MSHEEEIARLRAENARLEGAPPCRGKRRPPAPGSAALRAIERAGGMEACQGCLLPSARPAPVLASPDGAIHPATRPSLSRQQLRQSLLAA